MTSFAYLGSVSSGTMRPEDLVPEFLYVLGQLDKSAHDAVVEEYADVLDSDEVDKESDEYAEGMDYALEALFDRLNDCAPPYVYFGANEGDGADYGFWPSWDSIRDAEHDGTLLKIDAGDEWPDPLPEGTDAVMEVTDHGNVTLYGTDGKELWSCV